MEGKNMASPERPRGPSSPDNPQLAREHGIPVNSKPSYTGSSRSSLFGLFSRQPSRSNLASIASGDVSVNNTPRHNFPKGPTASIRTAASESLFGGFDNISFDIASTSLESPDEVHSTSRKMDRMLSAAEKYQKAMEALSLAAAEFGSALYECASTKGASSAVKGNTSKDKTSSNANIPLDQAHNQLNDDGRVAADLQASGGLHLLISNHAHLLATSLETQVVKPMRTEHLQFKRTLHQCESEFKQNLAGRMQALRRADEQRSRDSRKRRGTTNRDLLAYRSTLLDLTSQIDDINRLKFEFLGDLHAQTTDLMESLHTSMSTCVTAEIEVFESIARKGWSGGGLDGLLAGCPDPFAQRANSREYEVQHSPRAKSHPNNTDLFSIIPPQPLLPRRNSNGEAQESDSEANLTL